MLCDNNMVAITRNATWMFIGLFASIWLVVGRMIYVNSFAVRHYYPSISKYFGYMSFKRNWLFNVMIVILTSYLVVSAIFVFLIRSCDNNKGSAIPPREMFGFCWQLVFGALTLLLISPTKTYSNHYAGARCCCCPEKYVSSSWFGVLHKIGGLAVLLFIPLGHTIVYGWEIYDADGFDNVSIAHRIFFGISWFCILLAITFVISNQYCSTKLLAICGSRQAHQGNALLPTAATNAYGAVNGESGTTDGPTDKICCVSACKVLARWCGFKDSILSIDEIPVGDLHHQILLPDDERNDVFRLKDFGDIDDARYLHSEKIYKNENVPAEKSELRIKSSAALQASRTCSIWVEYVLILLNIILSSVVNINDVAEM